MHSLDPNTIMTLSVPFKLSSASIPSPSLSLRRRSGNIIPSNQNIANYAPKNHGLSLTHHSLASFPHRRFRFSPSASPALHSDLPPPHKERYEQWDSLTSKFSGASSVPFLLLQLPQIILNARNLLAGNKTALLAVPWLGMFTGLLGNISLLSYFAKKKEKEAVMVQTLGVISSYVIFSQLAMAQAMPLIYFIITSVVVAAALVLNFLNYFNMLNPHIWQFWEDFITVGGLSVLPQIMWSTFVPFIPNSILPGTIAFVGAVTAVFMARMGKLPESGVKFVRGISGWTATLLFMWMPVSQMWTNFLNPENIKGLSAVSMMLAMIGNGLMIPRALFIRDFMWLTGSVWATLFYGYGNLVCLYWLNIISRQVFLAATTGLISWLGMTLWRDSVAKGY